MLLFAGVRRLRARTRREAEPMVIEHDHPHDHGPHAHDHRHVDAVSDPVVPVGAQSARRSLATAHSHTHVHIGHLPEDPVSSYGPKAAFGIGMLHGVGAETPTQLLLFLVAAGAGGEAAGMVLLTAFIVGLVCSNSVIALLATFGSLGAARRWWLTVTVSSLTAAASLAIGLLFLTGHSTSLPGLFAG